MKLNACSSLAALLFACTAPAFLYAQGPAAQPSAAAQPWMDQTLPPDVRADMVLKQMTMAEKMQLVHGTGWGVLRAGDPVPPNSNHGAGFVTGIARLGIPDINLADSAVGVRMSAPDSRYATLLPSALGMAATWDLQAAHLYGEVIGRELRQQGFNMSIGGGVDIMREPRNGRNFEYAGEDPNLAGHMVGQLAMGVQSQQVMGDIKHYAVNDQETGRTVVDVNMDKRTMRETDLLAFEYAIEMAKPAGVMCAYNLVNTNWSCENDYLLNQVLKKDFGFKGFVLSDWEATHSTVKAANAGLDQEQPGETYFGAPLEAAIAAGQVPMARLEDMDHRILRSMFATGVVDHPPQKEVVDPFRGKDDSRHIAEESLVLLKNSNNLLPLQTSVHTVALIGGHADVGVLSGGGSAQVDAPGGNAVAPFNGRAMWGKPMYFPSSPMKSMQKLAPAAKLQYVSGEDIAGAVAAARSSDVAIVFATQYMTESIDSRTLSLPNGQDALIAAVTAANPRTVVVLETGGPVSMPWVGQAGAVMAAWYPGIGGGEAIADVLFGVVNPSGKLPATFARTEADLPLPSIAGMPPERDLTATDSAEAKVGRFEMTYPEGVAVGYRWFELKGKQPLFAFGHGLSYTTYAYADLKLHAAQKSAEFRVTNTGTRAGSEIVQIYATLPTGSGEAFKRLVGWQRVPLAAGESKTVTVPMEARSLSIFDTQANQWQLLPGSYEVQVGGASDAIALHGKMDVR